MRRRRVLAALARDRETGWRFSRLRCVPYLPFLTWMHVPHDFTVYLRKFEAR